MKSLRVVSLASALLLAAACDSGSVTAPVEAARPRFSGTSMMGSGGHADSSTGTESERGTSMLGSSIRTEETSTTQGTTTTGTEAVSDTTGTGTTTGRGTGMLGTGV